MIAVVISPRHLLSCRFHTSPAYPPSDKITYNDVLWTELARDTSFSWMINLSGLICGIELYFTVREKLAAKLLDMNIVSHKDTMTLFWFSDPDPNAVNSEESEIGDRHFFSAGNGLLLAFPTFGYDVDSFLIEDRL